MPDTSSPILQKSVVIAILVAGAGICMLICWSALQTNGTFGFPLDDSWIHLQFARNLRDYGSFSYYQNEMATSGSTSPLYTMLLAAGLFITSNEFILSYVLGVGFFTAGAFVLSRLGKELFKEQLVLIIGGMLLYFLEPRLQWIALSGMETTLFMFLLLLVWYLYRRRSGRWLGVTAGLLLWARPEAVIFFAVLAIDVFYKTKWVRHQHAKKASAEAQQYDHRWLRPAIGIAGVICLGYAVFNLVLSGSILPNTYAAKIEYYGSGGVGFPRAVFDWLTAGHMPVLAAFAAIAILNLLWNIVRRKPQDYLVPLLWSAALFVAYWQKLPFLYQEGRYLMPILPFIILLGLRGVEIAVDLIQIVITAVRKNAINATVLALVVLALVAQFGYGAWNNRGICAEYCKYITDRQVRTALWIRDHLPTDAVIGTHDVGAIAYYSGRRIADMVGLVSPDMIENIGSFDRLVAFLGRNRVTHLAVLRNWFEVANQNPLFTTDEKTPEIMQVFTFDPLRCHFTPQNVSELVSRGAYHLSIGEVQTGGAMLEEAVRLDPRSARANFHFGVALLSIGRNEEAERAIRTALGLQPDAWPALLALGHFALKRGEVDSALTLYKDVERRNPAYAPVYQALWQFYLTEKPDSASAAYYRSRYEKLAGTTPSETATPKEGN